MLQECEEAKFENLRLKKLKDDYKVPPVSETGCYLYLYASVVPLWVKTELILTLLSPGITYQTRKLQACLNIQYIRNPCVAISVCYGFVQLANVLMVMTCHGCLPTTLTVTLSSALLSAVPVAGDGLHTNNCRSVQFEKEGN